MSDLENYSSDDRPKGTNDNFIFMLRLSTAVTLHKQNKIECHGKSRNGQCKWPQCSQLNRLILTAQGKVGRGRGGHLGGSGDNGGGGRPTKLPLLKHALFNSAKDQAG